MVSCCACAHWPLRCRCSSICMTLPGGTPCCVRGHTGLSSRWTVMWSTTLGSGRRWNITNIDSWPTHIPYQHILFTNTYSLPTHTHYQHILFTNTYSLPTHTIYEQMTYEYVLWVFSVQSVWWLTSTYCGCFPSWAATANVNWSSRHTPQHSSRMSAHTRMRMQSPMADMCVHIGTNCRYAEAIERDVPIEHGVL